jgi:heme/copper-type cytochrome/quinol oxidase subunit 2
VIASREILRILILLIGAAQVWAGLRDLIEADQTRTIIFDSIIGFVLLVLIYLIWKYNRRA